MKEKWTHLRLVPLLRRLRLAHAEPGGRRLPLLLRLRHRVHDLAEDRPHRGRRRRGRPLHGGRLPAELLLLPEPRVLKGVHVSSSKINDDMFWKITVCKSVQFKFCEI